MPTFTRTLRGAALSALAVSLAGCVSLGGKVPDTLLTLTPDAAVPAGNTASSAGRTIAVIEPFAAQRLAVTRVPVQVNAANVAYLKEAVWVERPARLFRNLLAETIRSRTGRMVLDNDDTGVAPEIQLRGALRDFGYDAQTSSVVVRYDAIREQGGTATTRRFESVIPGIAPEAAPVGAALNQAANDVARQVADWVQ